MVRRRLLHAVIVLASVLALRSGIAMGAELPGSVPQQLSGMRVISGDLELRDEIQIDMKSGTVTRVRLGAPRLGPEAVMGTDLELAYSNLTQPLVQVAWDNSPLTRSGDIIQTQRAGVLGGFRFVTGHYGTGVLTSARYRVRFYDASVWPGRPFGYPTQLLATFETPTAVLNLASGQVLPITLVGLPFEPTLPRDLVVTIEQFDAVSDVPYTIFVHSAPGLSPAIGSSGPNVFIDKIGFAGETLGQGVGNLFFEIELRCVASSGVAPSTLNVSVPLGGSGGGSFSLSNAGCLPLTYDITAPANMSVSPSSGTVPPGGQHTPTVTVTPGIVSPGYSGFGDVLVTTNDLANPTRTVRVNYNVTGSVRRATPGVCYATQGSSGSPPTLYRVNLATGAATAVGPTSGVLVPTMAIEPREGRMYAALPSLLTRVDAAGGGLAPWASISCASATTFSPSGQFVMLGCDSTLYTVDLNTSLRLSVGPVSPHMGGIAFDPTSDLLYGVRKGAGPGTDQLYRIAFPGGATTLVGTLGLGLPIGDITFDESGNLYGVVGEDAAPNQLVSINKATAQATVIGATGVHGLSTLAYHAPTPNCRFASRVEGFSSQYGPTDYSAQQALGPPDTYPDYGGTRFWMGALPDSPSEYLRLGFANPAPINFVTVYETYAPGAIRSVRVKNPDTGLFETVWSGTPAAAPPASRVFTATFPVTPFPVSEVYLDVASDLVSDYNAIDAVGIGYRDFKSASQWASSVVGFSSQFSTTTWSAAQALGPPNLFPLYADAGTAWASATADGQREYLELAYATPSPINFVNVVETFSPGALDKVFVKNPGTGLFEQVWSGTAAPAPPVARINTASFPLTQFPVSQVRLEFDSPSVPNWNEIDAVGIGSCECTATLLDSPPPSSMPATSAIQWARPNPFAVSTSIGFSLARAGRVEVEVFDLLGKRTARLVDGTLAAGKHEIRWDGRDAGGRTVGNGVYYLRMRADGQSDSRKIIKLH